MVERTREDKKKSLDEICILFKKGKVNNIYSIWKIEDKYRADIYY